jgi:hypothetical protein
LAYLHPDSRVSDVTLTTLKRHASSLTHSGFAVGSIRREELGEMKPRDFLRSLNTVLGEHGKAAWILSWNAHTTESLLMIQIYVPPGLLEFCG